MDRKEMQDLYIRICRDSCWKMDHVEAAKFTGKMLNVSPIEVWCSFSGLDVMEQIAKGEHPACVDPAG